MKGGGIRLGSPSVTTRGLREPEMELVGGWITEVLTRLGDAETEQKIRRQVAELAARFPIYESRVRATGRVEHARV